MKAFAIPVVLAAAAAGQAQAAEVAIATQGPVVELQVSQQVLGDPDKAMVGAGVTTRAMTAVEAMRLNATEMEKVLTRLRQLGIADEYVQTTGITLSPQYNYGPNNVQRFLGYDAANNVSVELRDLKKIGPVLDALVAAGANNLSGPVWGIVDDEPQKAQARAAAFKAAASQAADYARMSGYSGVRLLAVEEQLGYQQPVYNMMERAVPTAIALQASTPTRPGRVASQVTLTVKYELTR